MTGSAENRIPPAGVEGQLRGSTSACYLVPASIRISHGPSKPTADSNCCMVGKPQPMSLVAPLRSLPTSFRAKRQMTLAQNKRIRRWIAFLTAPRCRRQRKRRQSLDQIPARACDGRLEGNPEGMVWLGRLGTRRWDLDSGHPLLRNDSLASRRVATLDFIAPSEEIRTEMSVDWVAEFAFLPRRLDLLITVPPTSCRALRRKPAGFLSGLWHPLFRSAVA